MAVVDDGDSASPGTESDFFSEGERERAQTVIESPIVGESPTRGSHTVARVVVLLCLLSLLRHRIESRSGLDPAERHFVDYSIPVLSIQV